MHEPMIQRNCPECSSELVRARLPDYQHLPGSVAGPPAGWRCSVCGRGFTTEQIRDKKHPRAVPSEHA